MLRSQYPIDNQGDLGSKMSKFVLKMGLNFWCHLDAFENFTHSDSLLELIGTFLTKYVSVEICCLLEAKHFTELSWFHQSTGGMFSEVQGSMAIWVELKTMTFWIQKWMFWYNFVSQKYLKGSAFFQCQMKTNFKPIKVVRMELSSSRQLHSLVLPTFSSKEREIISTKEAIREILLLITRKKIYDL